MVLFGSSLRASKLVDQRTEEEKAREIAGLLGSGGPQAMGGLFGQRGSGAPQMWTMPRGDQQQLAEGIFGDMGAAPNTSAPTGASPAGAMSALPVDGSAGGASPIGIGRPDLQAAPKKERMLWGPSTREKIAGALSDFGTALMAAQAARDGDFGASASLTQGIQQRALEARRRSRLGAALHNLGYGDDQITVALSDPASLGRNFNERLGTRVVAPGSSIVTGGPTGQEAAYSQPNAWEAYAKSQGLQPGTSEYNTALQDYILRSNGPTAFGYDVDLDDHRTANDQRLEADRQAGRVNLETLRQQGRIGLEDARQSNRVTTRQTPTYRDSHPRPGGTPRSAGAPRVPTATDPNGNTIYYRNGQWVDAQGRAVR